MDLALAELQRPAGVRILLRRWGGFVWPDLVRLDCILFSLGVALFGCRCQRCVDDLAALAQLTVEIGEQYFQRDGLGQLLAKQPDRVGIRCWCAKAKPRKRSQLSRSRIRYSLRASLTLCGAARISTLSIATGA